MRKSLLWLAALGAAQLAAGEDQNIRQADTHVHGTVEMHIVLENDQLLLSLESPAINVVGFEHAPGDAEQEQAITDAKATFADAGKVVALPAGANCQLAAADVDWSLDADHDEGHGSEAATDANETGDEHEADERAPTHSEFHASYAFACQSPHELAFADIVLFATFPGMKHIEVQVIGPNGQGAAELTAGDARVDF